MTDITHLSEAIINGINSLQEEVADGNGPDTYLAARNMFMATRLGNEQAARYWQAVHAACRRLEGRPYGTITIHNTQSTRRRKFDA